MVSFQSFLTALYGFYNTIFEPVLSLGPYPALAFFSLSLAAVFSIIYWLLLDIEKNKKLKEKISEKQDLMKEARKNENTDKASEHMQETMQLNQKMMMLNFKPMIATMVFVGLIFPWLGATFAPSVQMEEIDNTTFQGEMSFGGENMELTVTNSSGNITMQAGEQQVQPGDKLSFQGIDWTFKSFGEASGGFLSSGEGYRAKLAAVFIPLPFSIPLAGNALNWLGFYILIAMPLTYVFRKLLGVQ